MTARICVFRKKVNQTLVVLKKITTILVRFIYRFISEKCKLDTEEELARKNHELSETYWINQKKIIAIPETFEPFVGNKNKKKDMSHVL
jgi:hypothetical protein